MKKILSLYILFVVSLFSVEIKEDALKISSGKIVFLSEAPQETIKGVGKSISGRVNFKEKKLKVVIDLMDWKTNNRLQTSHLHENYLETETYPQATYDGVIKSYDSKTGEAVMNGSLTLHGKTKNDVIITGTVKKGASGYTFASKFSINLRDYSIEIPKLLILKVNEEVKLEANIDLSTYKD